MSFFADFFGKSQQRDISNANQQANASLAQGYNDAKSTAQQYSDQALSYYQPYEETGRKGMGLYADSLGINGAAGGQNALMAYQAGRNPHLSYEQDMAQRGMDRSANARGMLNSGTNALAVARARQQMGYQDYSGWQDRLQGVGNQGFQAANAMANNRNALGNYLADLSSGYGQQRAGNAINYGNATAASRSTGINNLISLGGLAVKASGYGAR